MLTGPTALGDLQRAVGRWRWLLASGLAAGAVATGLPALAPAPPTTTTVWAAAHDLEPGTALTRGDLTPLELPRAVVPDGALGPADALDGRTVAGRVRRGESLTDARLVGPGLLPPDDGGSAALVAVPVRLADAGVVALLHVGDRVDVLGAATSPAGGRAGPAEVVAAGCLVLAVPAPAATAADGALVVLAASSGTAGRLAAAEAGSRLSVAVRAVVLRG